MTVYEYDQTNSRKDILPRLMDKKGKLDLRIKLIITNLMALFLFWGGWVSLFHLALDDYNAYYNLSSVADFCVYNVYRFFFGISLHILNSLGIHIVKSQLAVGNILIIVWAICVSTITHELLTYFENKEKVWFLVNLGSLFLLANVFVGEWLYFTHSYPSWMLAIIGATYGAIYVSRGKRKIVQGVLFLTLLAGSYQAGIPIYVFLVMTLIFMKNSGNICKTSLIQVSVAAMALVLGVITNNVLVGIYSFYKGLPSSGRVRLSAITILSSLRQFVGFQKEIWIRCYGLLPNGVLLAFLIAFLGLLVYVLMKSSTRKIIVFFTFVVLLSGQIALYLIASTQTSFWNPVRIMVSLFGVFSCLVWLLVFLASRTKKDVEKSLMISMILGLCLLVTNYIGTQGELTDIMITNAEEQSYAERIRQRVTKYEMDSGCTITEVAFIQDQSVTWKYYSLLSTSSYWGEMSEKAFIPEWCNIQALNYYTGRNFIRIDVTQIPEDIREYIAGTDWIDENLDEQLIFRDNRMFIALF